MSARILYIEDDRIDQMAFEQYAKSHPFPFTWTLASTLAESTLLIKQESFDVILADYYLEDGTALDILKIVKRPTPVIFITAANDLKTAVNTMKAGAYDYLVKDLDRNYLGLLPHVITRAFTHRIADEELIKAKLELEESLKIKEQFLMNVSHEIRTPINAIVGFTDLMSKTPLQDEQAQYLKAIQTSSENLLSLINDILDFSRNKSGKIILEQMPFSLREVISRVQSILALRAEEKGLQFTAVIDPLIPERLIGDPSRLGQVLINLAGNAIKFTSSGEVTIRVSKSNEDDQQVSLGFSVSDTGIGIPENKLSAVFKEFVQASSETTRKYGGSGLGLSIARQLVEIQGGKLSVKSKPGEGSVFSFHLRFSKDDTGHVNEPLAETQETGKESTLAGLRVLIVEDNELNQVLIKKYLDDLQCYSEMAENGAIALQHLEQVPFDIVLMDIQMPEMDGYETTRRIRTDLSAPYAAIPILAMTAHSMQEHKDKCIAAGMNGYITKPIHRKLLKEEILAVIKQQPYLNMEQILTFLGSDEKFISSLLLKFADTSGARMKKLQALAKEGDWNNVNKEAHQMLSSTKTLHLSDLSNLFARIELLSSEKNELKKIPLLLDYASYKLGMVEKEIRNWLASQGESGGSL